MCPVSATSEFVCFNNIQSGCCNCVVTLEIEHDRQCTGSGLNAKNVFSLEGLVMKNVVQISGRNNVDIMF